MRIDVNIDQAALDRVAAEFTALPEEIDRASRRAVRKAVSWIETHVARGISQAHSVPLKSIKIHRMRASVTQRGDDALHGFVWIGISPVKASYLGALRQQRAGARSGKHFFERAFVATMKSGHRGIYKRSGKARLPIDEQSLPLDQAEQVVDAVHAQVPQRLTDLLAQEMNYETRVRGA